MQRTSGPFHPHEEERNTERGMVPYDSSDEDRDMERDMMHGRSRGQEDLYRQSLSEYDCNRD